MISVLKIGGGAGVNHERVLANLQQRIATGEEWIVVHGASALTNQLAAERGIPVRQITSPNGYVSRHTDATMIEIYREACITLNGALIRQLEPFAAIGLLDLIHAERKTAIRAIQNGRPVVVRDDYSGTITHVNAEPLRRVLAIGAVPVIAPLAIGTQGESLNVDGDLVAAQIARAVGAQTLVILSNVAGLLRDVTNPNSVIARIPLTQLSTFEGFAQGRMKKKLLAASGANIERVIIADSRLDAPLDEALSGAGTHILQEAHHVEYVR
jgi:[amino group carrier protein]-L-2-aminoadipate 6-kinase